MCKVCKRPIGADAVAFGVAGRPLFYTHKGKCSDMIGETVDATGKLARIALEIADPKLVKRIKKTYSTFQRVMRALSEEN
jgi:hypothetical protein